MFIIQGITLLGYLRFSSLIHHSDVHVGFVPTGDTRSRTDVATALAHSKDFKNLLNEIGYLEIKFPDNHTNSTQKRGISVAIGLAITTRSKRPANDLLKHIFFTTLMLSFCKTASQGYSYSFYLAFDFDDPLLSKKEDLEVFNRRFREVRNDACANLVLGPEPGQLFPQK